MGMQAFYGVFVLILVSSLGTAGVTALFTVWFPSLRRSRRVLLASVTVPIIVLVPMLLVLLSGEVTSSEVGVGMAFASVAIVLVPLSLLGWPVAHFLARALDRQRSEPWGTFE